ncbi:hypothetical protein DL767_006715 [Monosporascus sp. MG133]|nr:hypothetical protein DL767_006715 [Monosporascus sp. MG133]
METPPPPYQANARLRLLSADQEDQEDQEDQARLVAETTSMGNRFIHYRTEDALALMDNRVQLVGSFVDYNHEDMKGLFRDFKLSQQEEFSKMMSQIELGHDDVKAEVQLLREDVGSVVEASSNIDACRFVSMDEDIWSRFVDRGGLFSDFDELTCLQILNFEDESANMYDFQPVSEPIRGIVENVGLDEVKIEPDLMGPSPLKMTESSFNTLVKALSLPSQYAQALRDANTVFTEVRDTEGGCCQKAQSRLSLSSEGDVYLTAVEFVLQNRRNRKWRFGVGLTYYPERCLTMAFVHDLTAERILRVTRELAKHRGRLALPMLLPTILVEAPLQTAIFGVRDCHREIILVEQKTGLWTKWDSSEALSDMRKARSIQNPAGPVDFNAITADITSVKSKLAYVEYLCEVWSPKLVAFDRINSHTVESAPAEADGGRLVNVHRRLQNEINFHLTTLEGTQLRAKYLSKRADAQAQIAQRIYADNIRDNCRVSPSNICGVLGCWYVSSSKRLPIIDGEFLEGGAVRGSHE